MKLHSVALSIAMLALTCGPAAAEKQYGPGASDTEIKLGQTMPYSGPISAIGQYGRAQVAFYKMINDEGGINGRRATLISLDDGYSPPKTVEQTRKLVEQDGVLAIVSSLGTPTNVAIYKYLNQRHVPQLFIGSGASEWRNFKRSPWTISGTLNYIVEGAIYATYIRRARPNAKIAVLYQNDDFGRDLLAGLNEGLGDRRSLMIVAEATYETTDPTIDSQIISLKDSVPIRFSISRLPNSPRARFERFMTSAGILGISFQAFRTALPLFSSQPASRIRSASTAPRYSNRPPTRSGQTMLDL